PKKLVGGGEITIVNKTVPLGLEKLGYAPNEVDEVVAYIDERNTVVGAPYVKSEHFPVFDCAVGERSVHYSGHVKMMGAIQPFISGAISKTVNMPEAVTIDDVAQVYVDAWKLGVKAIAIYRDNCKVAQPLSGKGEKALSVLPAGAAGAAPRRRRLPDNRAAKSIVDYVFRWMGKKFLSVDQQEEIGILSPEVRARMAAAYATGAPGLPELGELPTPGQTALFNAHEDAIECSRCGGRMVRAGTCYTCRDCGTSTGCG